MSDGFNAYDVWSNDIGGNGQLVKNGSGVLALTGNNRFSGTTTVAGGSLIINGYHGNSAVTVNNSLLGQRYSILTAQQGIQGRFNRVSWRYDWAAATHGTVLIPHTVFIMHHK